jgi:hypothetical protein
VSYRRRLEVNVAQYEAALCAKVEGFDYAHGDYGGCLWAGEIGRERHDLILIWQSRNFQFNIDQVFPGSLVRLLYVKDSMEFLD